MIIFVRTLILYLLVIVVMRIMGKRQIGQLQPFELAITIMISELAAIPMQNTGVPLINGIIPILTLLCAQLILSFVSLKNQKFEQVLCGKPSLLIENGKINEANMKKELYTMNDLLEQLRLKNTPNIADVEFAILETNGDLSVVTQTSKRQPNLTDLNIPSIHEGLNLPVIIDGTINEENLSKMGLSLEHLKENLKTKNIDVDSVPESIKAILLATINDTGGLFIQFKSKGKDDHHGLQ